MRNAPRMTGHGGLALALLTVLFVPGISDAQPTSHLVKIGIVNAAVMPPPGVPFPILDAVRGRLRELGYVEGKTLLTDVRWAGGNYDKLPEMARELVKGKPDVIVVIGSKTAELVLDATGTIPVVAITCEPFPLVAALAHHGRNLTGVTCMSPETVPKRLELFNQVVPRATRIAFLYNPLDGEEGLEAAKATAAALKVTLIPVPVRSAADLEPALEVAHRERVEGIFVHPDVLIGPRRARIAEFALQHRLPSIDPFSIFPEVGGLMSYGSSLTEMSRRAAEQVDRLLKGAKIADLPIEQAMRFYLTINLKTAKALGVTIPPAVLLRADQLIE